MNHEPANPRTRVTPRFTLGWLAAGASVTWFARTALTVPTSGVLLMVAAVVIFAASYMAGWVARGRSRGR